MCLQPGLPFPEDLRHLFGDLSGLSGRAAGFGRPAAGFTMGTELAQAHAQAGTRAGGWAEGVGSSATAVNSLAGSWTILATHTYQLTHAEQRKFPVCQPDDMPLRNSCFRMTLPSAWCAAALLS